MDSAESERPGDGRVHRWLRRALVWLPALILATVVGAAGSAAALGGAGAATSLVEEPRPAVPLLDLRRDLGPLADAVADRRLRAALDEFVGTMPPDTCLVVHAGRVSFRHRAEDPQAPASAQKLLTAVAALMVLGPEHRFRTTVTGPPPADGVVGGDLHLVGGGDPLLAVPAYVERFPDPSQPSTDLTALADAVAAAGVVRIEGAVVADETRYDQQRYHDEWPNRFRSQGQTGPLSALAVNDGFRRWPARGLWPVEAAADPAALAGTVFVDLLAERGVVVTGGVATAPAPAHLPELAAIASPPLRDIVGQMLAQSDNGTAELLLKELGLVVEGTGSFASGARAVHDVLARTGFDMSGVVVVDGSGLGSRNAITCHLAIQLLEHPPAAEELAEGLAVVGESGTLLDRWVGTPLDGLVRAKTGTLNRVTALVGLAPTGDAEPARFALIVNVPDRVDPAIVDDQRRFVELLLSHPRRPDLDDFTPRHDRG